MKPAGRARIGNIDCVRGVAAFAVMLQHSMEHGHLISTRAGGFARSGINFGESGVVAFFLVSGFVIPLSLERYNNLAKFWWSRALRIYPLYITVAFVSALISASPLSFRTIIAQLLFASEYFHTRNLVGNSWTLSIELFWYLMFSVLFLIGINSSLKAAVSIAAAIIGVSLIAILSGHTIPAGRVGLVVTALLGLISYRIFSLKLYNSNIAVVGLMIILYIMLYYGFLAKINEDDAIRPWTVLMSWLVGYSVFFGSFIVNQERKAIRILAQLGTISFSVYLNHTFALWAFSALGFVGWTYVILVIISTIPVSIATYHFIELPAQRLAHRFPHRSEAAVALESGTVLPFSKN